MSFSGKPKKAQFFNLTVSYYVYRLKMCPNFNSPYGVQTQTYRCPQGPYIWGSHVPSSCHETLLLECTIGQITRNLGQLIQTCSTDYCLKGTVQKCDNFHMFFFCHEYSFPLALIPDLYTCVYMYIICVS